MQTAQFGPLISFLVHSKGGKRFCKNDDCSSKQTITIFKISWPSTLRKWAHRSCKENPGFKLVCAFPFLFPAGGKM